MEQCCAPRQGRLGGVRVAGRFPPKTTLGRITEISSVKCAHSWMAGKDTGLLGGWFQAPYLHETPQVAGVISLEGG
jgi:hypothetical protein